MQQAEPIAELLETNQIHAVVKTLPSIDGRTETLAEVAHDARNMVAALDLYCDLLQEPGVLASTFSHYGKELKLVAAASRSLIEKISTLSFKTGQTLTPANTEPATVELRMPTCDTHTHGSHKPQIENFAQELVAIRNMLAAIAGPFVGFTVDADSGALPVRLNADDLTRILVNLVKNATEAMSSVGRIHISLAESLYQEAGVPWLTLKIEDNGPGIPDSLVERIFEPGFISRTNSHATASYPAWLGRRGLGLSITRSLVEAAGGRIHAANRDPVGACFQIELPVRASDGDGSDLNKAIRDLAHIP